jgi:hypothetical protein
MNCIFCSEKMEIGAGGSYFRCPKDWEDCQNIFEFTIKDNKITHLYIKLGYAPIINLIEESLYISYKSDQSDKIIIPNILTLPLTKFQIENLVNKINNLKTFQ